MADNGGDSFPINREVEYDCAEGNGVKRRIATEQASQQGANGV